MATGFTLIEILIVVVILGILAGVVMAQINGLHEDAERAAFISSGQIFQEAAYRYYLDNGSFPEGRRSGRLPDGFGDYVTSQSWERATPIGGLWDMGVRLVRFSLVPGRPLQERHRPQEG